MTADIPRFIGKTRQESIRAIGAENRQVKGHFDQEHIYSALCQTMQEGGVSRFLYLCTGIKYQSGAFRWSIKHPPKLGLRHDHGII